MATKNRFDTEAFFAALDAQRTAQRLTWKDVAGRTGLSASTLTRIGQGRRPDVDGLASLLAWSGLEAESFIPGNGRSRPATLAAISTSLRSDPLLSPQSAETLERIVAAAYEQLRGAEADPEEEART
ncbi:MAG: XRE family transcriptional regulator [Chloroflexota bacterium]|nr:MAG: XRE family transcriptional regulator [Chloroflexota bacterium]